MALDRGEGGNPLRATGGIISDGMYRKNMPHLKQVQDPFDGAANAASGTFQFPEYRG